MGQLVEGGGGAPLVDLVGADEGDLVGGLYEERYQSFHEVHAIPLLDPVLDKQVRP